MFTRFGKQDLHEWNKCLILHKDCPLNAVYNFFHWICVCILFLLLWVICGATKTSLYIILFFWLFSLQRLRFFWCTWDFFFSTLICQNMFLHYPLCWLELETSTLQKLTKGVSIFKLLYFIHKPLSVFVMQKIAKEATILKHWCSIWQPKTLFDSNIMPLNEKLSNFTSNFFFFRWVI